MGEIRLNGVSYSGSSKSGGHVIQNDSGTALPQESALQFVGVYSEDDSTNGKTKVNIIREMTKAQMDALSTDAKKGVIHTTDEADNPHNPVSAEDVTFDPTDTSLQSTNVEDAIKEVASTSTETIGSTIIRRYGRLRTLSAMGGLISGVTSVVLTSSDRPKQTVTVATEVYSIDNTTFVGNGFVKIGASDGSVSLTVNGTAPSNTNRCYFTAVWIV